MCVKYIYIGEREREPWIIRLDDTLLLFHSHHLDNEV